MEAPHRAATLKPASGQIAQPRSACPSQTPDTKLSVQDTELGAALVFRTTGDVEALRRGVADWILSPALPSGPPRRDRIASGIRLVFDARDDGQLSALRTALRAHAEQLGRRCGLVLTEASEPEETEEQPPPPSPPPAAPAPPEAAADAGSAAPIPAPDAAAEQESGAGQQVDAALPSADAGAPLMSPEMSESGKSRAR
jgi:hypothetical protein